MSVIIWDIVLIMRWQDKRGDWMINGCPHGVLNRNGLCLNGM